MSVCVSKCVIFFLDQNDTLTSQRLIHHCIAKQQRDIYGRLMLLIWYSGVPQKKRKEVKEKDYKERQSLAFIFKQGHAFLKFSCN